MAEKVTAAKKEAKYSKTELIANAALFEVTPEIVAAALLDKEEATKKETETAVKSFLTRKKGAK
ncbi:oligoribonuclease [Lysinibacillus sp. 54212]|uniref:oligoribonuclease n=1 Tax=Lysinibacillus sp. 54212 TaxID=3119829 RepID=UPI002FC79534